MCKYFFRTEFVLFSFPSCKDSIYKSLQIYLKVADLTKQYIISCLWPYQYLHKIRTKQFVFHFFLFYCMLFHRLLFLYIHLSFLALDFAAKLCKSRISSKRTLLFLRIIHFLVDHLNKLNQFHYCRDQLSSLNKIW